jgi:NADPH2:quinone reductase
MRATLLREFGPPDRLLPVTLADPTPGDRQVVIATELAGVTFVETQIRAGRAPRPDMLPDLPAVLGNAVGGVVQRSDHGSRRNWSAGAWSARCAAPTDTRTWRSPQPRC